MKCLEKDRTRRYQTANGLASDIARHLSNEPIVARPPSRLYRFRKSVQRNKLSFAAATTIALALIIGLAVSTTMYFKAQAEKRNAQAEKKKAQTEAAKSQQVAQFLRDMLQGVRPGVGQGRDTAILREILDQTADRIGRELKTQPEVDAELRNTIGSVYLELGDPVRAETMFREAVTLRQNVIGGNYPAIAESLNGLGRALWRQGKGNEAKPLIRKGLEICRKELGDFHAENLTIFSSASLLPQSSKLDALRH